MNSKNMRLRISLIHRRHIVCNIRENLKKALDLGIYSQAKATDIFPLEVDITSRKVSYPRSNKYLFIHSQFMRPIVYVALFTTSYENRLAPCSGFTWRSRRDGGF